MIDAGHLTGRSTSSSAISRRAPARRWIRRLPSTCADCRDCVRAVRQSSRHFMDGLRQGADAEADAVFPAECPARAAAADRPPARARRIVRRASSAFPGARRGRPVTRRPPALTAPLGGGRGRRRPVRRRGRRRLYRPERIQRGCSTQSDVRAGRPDGVGDGRAAGRQPGGAGQHTQAESPDDDAFLIGARNRARAAAHARTAAVRRADAARARNRQSRQVAIARIAIT